MPFYPGPGVGGHCIPIDPFYLTYISRRYDYHTRLIELAGEINDLMPEHVLDRLMKLLNRRKKCLNGAKIVVLGLAYKKDIEDMRESPALKIFEHLENHKAEVSFVDPYIESFDWNGQSISTVPLTKELIKNSDAVLIITDHRKNVDYEIVAKHADLIFDTKNVLKKLGFDGNNIEVL
jgi:nucleotide sugar dehydrogenase